ncbi:hypothetical protein niasHT_038887 [Heterodera trifolii]|uniref:Uncharacterized protein n=1 Tax=Heterodera trifolii TaxID=157864 RepID=A0ABD2IRI7_9BILA
MSKEIKTRRQLSEVINSECKKSGGKTDRERTTKSGRQRTSGRDSGRQQAIGREKTEEANSGTKANSGRQRASGTGDAAAGGQEMEEDTKRNDERKEDEENAESSAIVAATERHILFGTGGHIIGRTSVAWPTNSRKELTQEQGREASERVTNHLEGCLEGRASAIISGIPMSEQGYDDAIDLLLKNFGDSKRLIRNLNNELLRLPISRSFDEDEQLYLKCEKIFRQLLGLRQNVEDSMYFANIEGKMSAETLDKYCAIKDAEDADDWNTTKFRDAFSRALDQIRHRQELKKSVTDNSADIGQVNADLKVQNAVSVREEVTILLCVSTKGQKVKVKSQTKVGALVRKRTGSHFRLNIQTLSQKKLKQK